MLHLLNKICKKIHLSHESAKKLYLFHKSCNKVALMNEMRKNCAKLIKLQKVVIRTLHRGNPHHLNFVFTRLSSSRLCEESCNYTKKLSYLLHGII